MLSPNLELSIKNIFNNSNYNATLKKELLLTINSITAFEKEREQLVITYDNIMLYNRLYEQINLIYNKLLYYNTILADSHEKTIIKTYLYNYLRKYLYYINNIN